MSDESDFGEDLNAALGLVFELVTKMTVARIPPYHIFAALSQQAAEVLCSQGFPVERRAPMANYVRDMMLVP